MTFKEYYNSLKEEFIVENLFFEILCEDKKIKWPKSGGVYLIWKDNIDSINNLVYVGKTGTFKRNSNGIVKLNNGNFNQRANRWTPYKFCSKEGNFMFHFRYGPLFSNNEKQRKIQNDDNAYFNSIPYSRIIIHCFQVDETHPIYTSTLLESLILSKYLKTTDHNLPVGNNEL
jgi:hypothetical protein